MVLMVTTTGLVVRMGVEAVVEMVEIVIPHTLKIAYHFFLQT
jgi:hypothetical protein